MPIKKVLHFIGLFIFASPAFSQTPPVLAEKNEENTGNGKIADRGFVEIPYGWQLASVFSGP